jgi:hypothetical protein
VTAAAGVQFRMILSSVSDSQVTEGGSTITLVNQPNSYLFYTCYNSNNEIIPDTVIYNDEKKTTTFTFSGDSVPDDVRICYEYGIIRTNEIYLDNADFGAPLGGSFATVLTDNAPQLTLYGIGHDIAYGDNKRNFRRGWVNHIDSYRSPTSTHMVAGLGGNLYAAIDADMPTYYAKLRVRASGEQYIGPAFALNANPPPPAVVRTRGVYSFTGSGTGWATVTKAKWTVSGVEYTLSTPNRSVTVGKTPIQLGDYLTLKGMPFSRHNGTFKITSVNDANPNLLVIVADNPAVSTNDYDDEGCSGSGGIFSDRFGSNTNPNPFLPDDKLLSSSWGDETELYVSDYNLNVVDYYDVNGYPVYRATDSVHVVGCYENIRLGNNLLITGERTSDSVPLRTVANVASVAYIVPGDTVSVSEQTNLLQVKAVDTVKKIVTFDSSITWQDSVTLPPTFQVVNRWLPVESPFPDAGDSLIPTTSVRYFTSDDYDNQSFLRSAMVQNNLYLTNGKDEVYKYDGTHNYRAGIIPWQPGLFATVEEVNSGGIPLVGFGTVTVQALTGNKLEVTKVDSVKFKVGDTYLYQDSNTRQYLTLESNIEKDNSSHYLTFKEPLQFTVLGTTPTLSLSFFARYYFRLNIKDVNGVVTCSAVTGAEDFVVTVNPTVAKQQRVHLRLVGLPVWDQYDFRNKNIELQVYRTFWTTTEVGEVPVFSRLPQTKACTFSGSDGYIDIIDTYSNDTLAGPDLPVGVLSPGTIPAAWDEPPRAKYVTTSGNRLVLANITDWPTLVLAYLATATVSEGAFDNQKIQFLKSATSTASTTDMVNSVIYQYVQPTLPSITGTWSNNSFTITVSSTSGINVGASISGTGIAANSTITAVNTGTSQLTLSLQTTSAQTGMSVSIGNYHTATGLSYDSTTKLVTVTCANHGRAVGDWVYFFRTASSGEMNTNLCGWWQISAVQNSTSFSVKWTSSGSVTSLTLANEATKFCHATVGADVPVWLGTDYNMGMVNGQVVGFGAPDIRIIRRLGMAINATMRMVDTTIQLGTDPNFTYPYRDFVPWMIARSESDTSGQLIVKQPRASGTVPAVKVSTTLTSVGTYINGSLVTDTGAIPAVVNRYPSRLAVSYDNYPEIFDNLWAVNADDSDSILDINSSDGQEITGIIPFFGDSAFGAALQSSVLVVFKQNSIYLVDLSAKLEGKNAVQRLQTQGLGCTAPYSIAPTKNGIAFANDSGIYVLRTNQTIEYLGRYMERNWQEKVDGGALSIAQGHHYGVGRQYKLSVPMAAESSSLYAENSEVYVYNHTGEADGESGGWARYTNHPVTGWANLFQNAFLATANGSVMRVRSSGEVSDYRDGNAAIEAVLEARAVSFGNTGIRKTVSNIVINYRSNSNSNSTFVYTSPDLFNDYTLSTLFRVLTKSIKDGLSSTAGQAVVSVLHSIGRRRCIYMSVKIVNSAIDENVEVAGMSYVVSGLTSAGIKQAAET